jgi:hypothetical protein
VIDHPAAPPLIMTMRGRYHAVTAQGEAACDPDLALNLDHTQEVTTVPAGNRCIEPACVALFREAP